MTNLGFWMVWTIVSALGVKYAANTLLDKDINFLSSILLILVYQWIRFIKPPDNNQNKTEKINKTSRLPPPNKKIK
jgi:membrane protein implicated in regulation of membrane protease activity